MTNVQPTPMYTPPVLVRLGAVSALTLGGAGGSRMELMSGSCLSNRMPGTPMSVC